MQIPGRTTVQHAYPFHTPQMVAGEEQSHGSTHTHARLPRWVQERSRARTRLQHLSYSCLEEGDQATP